MCNENSCVICMGDMPKHPPNNLSMKKWGFLRMVGKGKTEKQCETLKCGHSFHLKCIKEWFFKVGNNASKNCPMCRANIQFSNKFGISNRKMYQKRDWKIEKSDEFDDYSDNDSVFSDSDADSLASDDSFHTAFSNSSSAFDNDLTDCSGEWSDCSDDGLSDCSDDDWSDCSDDDWSDCSSECSESDYGSGSAYSRDSYTSNHLRGLDFNIDYDFVQIYDRSYNRFTELVRDNLKILGYLVKIIENNMMNAVSCNSEKEKLWINRQGQDFGCSMV